MNSYPENPSIKLPHHINSRLPRSRSTLKNGKRPTTYYRHMNYVNRSPRMGWYRVDARFKGTHFMMDSKWWYLDTMYSCIIIVWSSLKQFGGVCSLFGYQSGCSLLAVTEPVKFYSVFKGKSGLYNCLRNDLFSKAKYGLNASKLPETASYDDHSAIYCIRLPSS